VLADIAQQTLPANGSVDWHLAHNHDHLRSLIAQVIPGWEPLADISKTKQEFHLKSRIFHTPQFPTKTGRAHFNPHPIPALPDPGPNQFNLMTVRSEGQFNTVVYEEEDIYRAQDRRNVILLNPADMQRMNFKENQLVTVHNETGRLTNILARPFDIATGCALMYYPEANALVPRTADPKSKTPAFKSALVTVEPATTTSSLTPLTIASNPANMKSQREAMKAC
jgi:anaerobic selenocysteine-containing dehydrogenase